MKIETENRTLNAGSHFSGLAERIRNCEKSECKFNLGRSREGWRTEDREMREEFPYAPRESMKGSSKDITVCNSV
jgi:hypothetical protein